MSCGLLDQYKPFPNANHLDADARWITLHVSGRAVAIEEGLLVPYEFLHEGEVVEVCFTDRLYAEYGGSPVAMKPIAETGFKTLSKPHRDDTVYLRRRVIREADILVIQDRYGITFMELEDW